MSLNSIVMCGILFCAVIECRGNTVVIVGRAGAVFLCSVLSCGHGVFVSLVFVVLWVFLLFWSVVLFRRWLFL